jgi:hypothetical protein
MKYIFYPVVIILLTNCNDPVKTNPVLSANASVAASKNTMHTDSLFLIKYPLLSWAGKSPVEIGCMLETEFSFKDSVFNCAYKNYINKGDPCKKTKEYYEGINFPEHLVAKVHPSVKEMDLKFEHGQLQEITITFKDSLLKDKIRQLFNLPAKKDSLPANVMSIGYGENVYSKDKPSNPKYTRWLSITCFEHMGAGDVDCN